MIKVSSINFLINVIKCASTHGKTEPEIDYGIMTHKPQNREIIDHK